MSLAIDVDKIFEVLLADGWHKVTWNKGRRWNKDSEKYDEVWVSSFGYDAYEYEYQDHSVQDSKNSSTGFEFWEGNARICGPMLAILAVKVYSDEQMVVRARQEEHGLIEAEKHEAVMAAEMAAYRDSHSSEA